MPTACRCCLYKPRGIPSKFRFLRSSSHSGVLSNSERGGCTSHAAGESASDQCSPDLQHAGRVGLDDVVHAEFAPHPLDGVDRVSEMRGIGGERDGADGAGGGAGDHLKRAARNRAAAARRCP